MDPNTLKILQGAAGAAGDDVKGVEDVFSTDVWIGSGSARTITTGVDLTGGGMMWFFNRDNSSNIPNVVDTESGINKYLVVGSPGTAQQNTSTSRVTAVSSTGYSIGNDSDLNNNNDDCVGWTFKKQRKFFTCLTYTGTGSARTQSHDLGSVPGAIIIKRTDDTSDWQVYHRGIGATKYLKLNSTSSAGTDSGRWNNTAPTASVFSLGDQSEVNGNGSSYVAYLFAHEEASFGPNSDQEIISCGSFTGNGSTDGPTVTLPFEPAWIMLKAGTDGGNWWIADNIRGLRNGSLNDQFLKANSNAAESGADVFEINPNGFKINHNDGEFNSSGQTMTFIAIAAENGKTMKAIETPSEVFAIDTGAGSTTLPNFDSGFAVDFAMARLVGSTASWDTTARLMEGKYLVTNLDSAQASSGSLQFDCNTGWSTQSVWNSGGVSWMWKRHAGFDVVCYNGTGANRLQAHSLGKKPEFYIVKKRDSTRTWYCYHEGLNDGVNPETYTIVLDSTSGEDPSTWTWNSTAPTTSTFSLANNTATNGSGSPYLALLFASIDGVSQVGFYDGQVADKFIQTNFAPKFLIIKRVNTSQNWLVVDTTRGWGSGSDQIIALNDNPAQSNSVGGGDIGTLQSNGFTLKGDISDWCGAGSRYIYY